MTAPRCCPAAAAIAAFAIAVGAAACSAPQQPAPAPAAVAVVTAAPPVVAETLPDMPSAPPDRPLETGPIRVGILHSLSGTMAATETSLKDVALMAIEELNQKGGVLGRKLEPVVVDPASNWPLFAEKANELIVKDGVAVIFGCYTSVSRKSVLPTLEERGALLFYPAQYEGEESSSSIFYTGATPAQQALPAVEYLLSPAGGAKKRWVLHGTDYVFPRQTNKVLREFLSRNKVAESDILESYTPFGHLDYQTIVAGIRKFRASAQTVVVSTLWGDSNVAFYKELAKQRVKSQDLPVLALSVGEEELRGFALEGNLKPFIGHLAAWNYFMSIESPENARFVRGWQDFAEARSLPDGRNRVTNDPMEATYIGITLWARAVEKAGATDVESVRRAMNGQAVRAPSGYEVKMDGKSHRLQKPVFVGKIGSDAQFTIAWKSTGP
jgi:urea transport system substrate-binding protein